RPGGRASRPATTAPRSPPAARGCCTAPSPRCWRTSRGRSWRPTRSRPGSTIPVSAQSTPTSGTRGGRYDTSTDAEALQAFRELARLEGIIPALEPSHAVAWLLREGGDGDGFDVLTLSGRGDKDMDEVTAKLAASDA